MTEKATKSEEWNERQFKIKFAFPSVFWLDFYEAMHLILVCCIVEVVPCLSSYTKVNGVIKKPTEAGE